MTTYLEAVRASVVFVCRYELRILRREELQRLGHRSHRRGRLSDLGLDHLVRLLAQARVPIAEPLNAKLKLLLKSLILFILYKKTPGHSNKTPIYLPTPPLAANLRFLSPSLASSRLLSCFQLSTFLCWLFALF